MTREQFYFEYGNRSFERVSKDAAESIDGYMLLDAWGDVTEIINADNYEYMEGTFDYMILMEDRRTGVKFLVWKYNLPLIRKGRFFQLKKVCRASKIFRPERKTVKMEFVRKTA